MAKRGVQLMYETVREWCRQFGPLEDMPMSDAPIHAYFCNRALQ